MRFLDNFLWGTATAAYQVPLQEQDLHDLKVTPPAELVLCVIVTLPHETSPQLTVNLQGPVLVNRANGWAKQFVITHGPYQTCHPLHVTPALTTSP